jgi:hypothetical protein
MGKTDGALGALPSNTMLKKQNKKMSAGTKAMLPAVNTYIFHWTAVSASDSVDVSGDEYYFISFTILSHLTSALPRVLRSGGNVVRAQTPESI